MPINVQDLPAKEVNVLNKNTGFPEPLSPDRNTTLPHPEADTSPNASIEAPDGELTRTYSRSSFLHRRHQSKNSFGSYGKSSVASFGSFASGDAKGSGLYDNTQDADGTREGKNTRTLDGNSPVNIRGNSLEPVPSTEENGNGLEEASVMDLKLAEIRDEQGYLEGDRKKGVLRKLNLHKA